MLTKLMDQMVEDKSLARMFFEDISLERGNPTPKEGGSPPKYMFYLYFKLAMFVKVAFMSQRICVVDVVLLSFCDAFRSTV